MGNGLGIKEKDLHGLSGSGFWSEIILANININTEVNYFRTIDPESHKQHRKRLISGISRKGRAAGKKIRRSHVQAKSSLLLLSGKHRTGRLARSSHRASDACLCALQTGLELNHHATHLSALIQGIWGVGRPRWPRATSFYTMHGPAGGVNF